jgi:hypothetical protein
LFFIDLIFLEEKSGQIQAPTVHLIEASLHEMYYLMKSCRAAVEDFHLPASHRQMKKRHPFLCVLRVSAVN